MQKPSVEDAESSPPAKFTAQRAALGSPQGVAGAKGHKGLAGFLCRLPMIFCDTENGCVLHQEKAGNIMLFGQPFP